MTSRWLWVSLVTMAACTCPGQEYVQSGVAPPAQFGPELAACARRDCDPLCVKLFGLTPADQVEMCEVGGVDSAGNSHVIARYLDASVCASSDSTDIGIGVDGTVDDGSSDGSTSDGSSDDGTGDGSTGDGTGDGSTGDGSTGDGGDGSTGDGSTGDGGDGGDGSYFAGHAKPGVHPLPTTSAR